MALANQAIRRLEAEARRAEPVVGDWSKTQDRLDKLERSGDQWAARAWGVAEKLVIAGGGATLGYFLKR